MTTVSTTITADWYPASNTYEPRDQQADLHDGYWAEIGPRGRRTSDGWWWAVAEGIETADSGWAADEAGAKAAVADWAEADLLAAQIAEGVLSEAFTAYGHTPAAVAQAALAVAATSQIRKA